MKVVILAGGYGTRLSEYTSEIPKPMVNIGDIPILEHILNYYSPAGDIYKIAKFAEENNYDLSNKTLKDLLKIIIKEKFYKKNNSIRYFIYNFIVRF